ncbi:putative adenylate kinase 1 chloroplastic [Bienertia sinuspersici]
MLVLTVMVGGNGADGGVAFHGRFYTSKFWYNPIFASLPLLQATSFSQSPTLALTVLLITFIMNKNCYLASNCHETYTLDSKSVFSQLLNKFSIAAPGSIQRLLQEEILEGVIDIDLVVNLKLREEALLAKCLGRRICSECGGNYNIACIDIKGENGSPGLYMAPLLPPTECAEKLITRSDDNEEVVRERLRIYDEMTRPVEEFYSKRGKLLKFDLPGGIPESWPKLLQALNLDDHEDGQSAAA